MRVSPFFHAARHETREEGEGRREEGEGRRGRGGGRGKEGEGGGGRCTYLLLVRSDG